MFEAAGLPLTGAPFLSGQRTAFPEETQASPNGLQSDPTVNRESQAVTCGVKLPAKNCQLLPRTVCGLLDLKGHTDVMQLSSDGRFVLDIVFLAVLIDHILATTWT